MFMSPDEFPLPHEYRDMELRGRRWARRRTTWASARSVFLDCGNIDRMPVDFLQHDGPAHPQHRPPPRQHALRHGQPRGARRLVHGRDRLRARARSSGPEITPDDRRRALRRPGHRHRAGSCTRTPPPRPHRMAAELIEAGVDAARRLPAPLRGPAVRAGLSCCSARWPRVQRYDDGALTIAQPDARATSRRPGALETDSEGIVDHMRAVEGTEVAVLVRELLADDRGGHAQGQPARHRRPRRRVDDRALARRRRAPPGRRRLHRAPARRAGGASSARRSRAAALSERTVAADGRPALSEAGGDDVARRASRRPPRARERRGRRRSATRARSTRSPPACCWCWSGAATRAQRFLMALPKTYRAVARLGWTLRHRRPRGRAGADRPRARRTSRCPPAS